MTEQRTIARGKQSGDEVPVLGEQFWRHRYVHAPMNAVQHPSAQGLVDS
ncbi:MAG TPA: hypothetical protein VM712_08745 [Gaiellales bacterium]|nr:hypothetical protein [Gaiellales bacterium]